MKQIVITVTMLLITIVVRAQLVVNADNKVGIGTDTEFFEPILMVGDHSFFYGDSISIGIAGSPEIKNGNNIGVEGTVNANQNFSWDNNYGVLGIVYAMNNTHGRNYGVCGMIDNPGAGNFYGGAGIYATSYDYWYSNPANLQGAYAAFFSGSVFVSNNLTATSIFTTLDNRLCKNVVSMIERDGYGRRTLDNLLSMKVVEYNLKSRLNVDIPKDIAPEEAAILRKEVEFLKKEDLKMTSRRHFGIDAQELQKVYPDLVLDSKDSGLSVNYLEMVPLIIRSIQELKQEMDEVREITR